MKLNIVCRGNDFFIKPLLRHWQEDKEYEIVDDTEKADVVWVEWANEQSVKACRNTDRKNIIVRMHESEYYQNYWKHWNDNIAALIQTNPYNYVPAVKSFHIPQPIDTDFWSSCADERNKNSIVMVGNFNYKKNHIGLLRTIMSDPVYFDEILFIGDTAPEAPICKAETRKLLFQIKNFTEQHDLPTTIQGFTPPKQLRGQYQRIGFLASPSIDEGCHTVVAEAMSCGTPVLIQDWMGAGANYPEEIIYTTAEDFWDLVRNYRLSSEQLREWAEQHFSEHKLMPKIDRVIKEVAE